MSCWHIEAANELRALIERWGAQHGRLGVASLFFGIVVRKLLDSGCPAHVIVASVNQLAEYGRAEQEQAALELLPLRHKPERGSA